MFRSERLNELDQPIEIVSTGAARAQMGRDGREKMRRIAILKEQLRITGEPARSRIAASVALSAWTSA